MGPKIVNDLNGWLVIDKPYGMGSTEVVSRLKRLFHPRKIGHAGTLDPLATGVLPIAMGKATRTVPFVMNGLKKYTFQIQFGQATTTDDLEGEVIATSDHRPSKDEIEAVLPSFTGDILQVPPAYSALKTAGKRAYEKARKGEVVSLPPRPVHVESLTLTDLRAPDKAVLTVTCGKGTYVRSLGRDIARQCGSCGCIAELRRTQSGPFTLADAISLDKLEKEAYSENPREVLIPLEAVLTDILELAVSENEARALGHGRAVPLPAGACFQEGDFLKAMLSGRLIAFGYAEGGMFRPSKVFKGENDVDYK